MKPLVSIIIPVYNQLKYTQDCLKDIINHIKIPYELIVIDNNSTDGTEEFIKKKYPTVVHIKNKKNLGFAKAVNKGILAAKGKYCVVLNNDIRIYEDICFKLVKVLKENPSIGVVGAKNHLAHLKNQIIDINYVGFCLCFKKAIIKKAGLISEDYGLAYGEDVDFCLEIKKLGLRVATLSGLKIKHLWWKTSSKLKNFNRNKKSEEAAAKIKSKWGVHFFKVYSPESNEALYGFWNAKTKIYKKGVDEKKGAPLRKKFFNIKKDERSLKTALFRTARMYDIDWCADLIKKTYPSSQMFLIKQKKFKLKRIQGVKNIDIDMKNDFNMSFEFLRKKLKQEKFDIFVLPMNCCDFNDYKKWLDLFGKFPEQKKIIIDLFGRIFIYPDLKKYIYARGI